MDRGPEAPPILGLAGLSCGPHPPWHPDSLSQQGMKASPCNTAALVSMWGRERPVPSPEGGLALLSLTTRLPWGAGRAGLLLSLAGLVRRQGQLTGGWARARPGTCRLVAMAPAHRTRRSRTPTLGLPRGTLVAPSPQTLAPLSSTRAPYRKTKHVSRCPPRAASFLLSSLLRSGSCPTRAAELSKGE